MAFLRIWILVLVPAALCQADAWDEFCEWRTRCGLPQIQEDPVMTKWAQEKANFRAYYRLKNGHQGPRTPAGWREGTGEAKSFWGWLTCCQEEDAAYGGAGICIGLDGERYMVLALRGGSGRSLFRSRTNIPIHDTSRLTAKPYRIQIRTKERNFDVVR